MRLFLKHALHAQKPFVPFVLLFTLPLLALNSAAPSPILLACVSLLFQIPLFISAAAFAAHRNHTLVDSLQPVYALNALVQLFIVRLFAPHIFAWILAIFYHLFPNFAAWLIDKFYNLADKLFNVSDMLGRNALQISFNLIDNVFNDPELAADLGLTSIWNFASAFMGGSQSDLITRKPFEAQWSPRKALSSLIARALPKIPLFFTIPTELVKYRVFTKAFRSYHSLNPVPTCQDILALAIVVSLPIAHIQVVSSSGVAANLRFNNQARNTIFNRFFPIIGVYAFGMISSGMLGVALAENAVLRRSRRMRNARIFSFLLMALGDVMIAFSTFSGILSSDVIAMTWSILLAMLLISALVLWRRAMQLNGDEHGNSVRRRAE